jgi:hypothetical protein
MSFTVRTSHVPGPAFYISSANDAVLQGNTVRNTNTQPLQNKWNGAGDLNSPIVINDASNILLLHNTISGGRYGATGAEPAAARRSFASA